MLQTPLVMTHRTRTARGLAARGPVARRLTARALRLACAASVAATSLQAQGGAASRDLSRYTDPTSHVARAARLQGPAPHIDGALDEAAWNAALPIRDFVQKVPIEGNAPTVATEVRILYDDGALYVGARLMRPDPRAIRRSVTRRDGESDAEVFTVSLDPYFDRRTAYAFSISSGGVRGDAYHAQDSEDSGREPQYDPIWVARARVDSAGWTAELRIPFSQVRYNAAAQQVWGLQLTRYIADKAERLQWVLIPVDAAGYASRFGRLEGIGGIPPTRRIELLPYVATEVTARSHVDARNPFDDRLGARAGADLKVGLGPNLSLDATINPDFGQVEADPAVVNLTAFEQVFEERRPFFVEGNELLTGRGQSFIGRPTWFYSRRIGAPPRGLVSDDFVDAPTNTTITTAAKVTGRLARGLSLGALAAVTPREFARTYHVASDSFARIAVEPPSRFGVLRLQQEFGKQQSNIGMSFTTVNHALDQRGGLASLLVRDAVAGGVDWKLRYRQGMYEVTGWVGGSRVSGDAPALARLQRNSAHFFQRPDQDYVRYDSTRTALSGATASLRLDKNAGRYTLGGIQLSTRTPGFEINDAGQMRSGDDIDFNADIQLRDTKPNRYVRFYQFGTSTVAGWNYGGVRQYLRFNQTAQVTLHSFLRLNARGTLYVPSLSDDLTRGGPLIGTPAGYSVLGQVTSRANMPTTWNARTEYYRDAFEGWRWDLSTGIATRPAPQWQASVDPTYSRSVDMRQYVATRSGGGAATFGQRYIFAAVERSTLSARFRVNYALTPNFTIEGYAEPFAASGRFYEFGEVPAPRSDTLRVYGAPGSGTSVSRNADGSQSVTDGASTVALPALDFQRLSFRSNLVLRWEWLPGSTAFFVWQQNRGGQLLSGNLVRPNDLWDAVRADGDNFVVVKVSYWIGAR
ncbi:MAG: carbohydrate binding family 9 domain-containing protein [Gemmatimonadaceae bacterium]|nr:carbohydrate binding family 9 domain-containing protein [Gemmatimonadaceae bacterium]